MKFKSLQIASFIIILASFFSCNNKDEKKEKYTRAASIEDPLKYTASNHPGQKLMENNCYLCHSPSADMETRIAPPMVAVKSHYLNNDTTKEEFIAAMWHFVEKPTEEKVKMKGAVRKFGLMPYQKFAEKDIKLIADYMYDFKIEEPEGFKKHIEEESKGKMKYRNDGISSDNSTSETLTPSQIGMKYALSTKKELGKNLMGTIQKKGTLEAVTFCNKQAYPITDSMALAQNATIRRVSDKPRNPNNQANAKELGIIAKFKKAIAANETYEPITEIENKLTNFYYPITTNTMCLQCHGTPNKEMEPLVLDKIKQLYPKDAAIGYNVNEVRGIWSITFKEL